jgi:signal transduction histidine kinase/CheY-like chemotaxis protein
MKGLLSLGIRSAATGESPEGDGFDYALRIPLRPIIAGLWALGVLLLIVGDLILRVPLTHSRRTIDWLVLILSGAILAWLLDSQRPALARWLTVAWVAGLVLLAAAWLKTPALLTLLAVPPVLAAVLIGVSAATVVAVSETLLLLATTGPAIPGFTPGSAVIAALAIWAVLGTLYLLFYQVGDLLHWTWDHFRRAQDALEEARDRKVELEQALADLAHANQQLTRLNILAQRLRQEAEEARTAKQQFVANVSHELRTPLNMVIGFGEMMLQMPESYGGHVPPALLADLEVIYRNARHLSELVDDVLDLSQIEADQVALTKEYTDFAEIVEAATAAVRPLFESKSLYLKTDLPESLPSVYCDSTRIREVLLNLLSNAGRFTDRGGVTLRIRQEGNDLMVSVADTGAGIAAQDLSRIFEPFRQADDTIRRRYGGTGLGLSISKRFIELHEGRIWVESEVGAGTTFFFRLPIAPAAPLSGDFARWLEPDWEHIARTRPSMAPRAPVRPRFVVLERGEALRRLLTRRLAQQNAEIVSVQDLDEALRELARSPSEAFVVNELSVADALQRVNYPAILPRGTPVIVCAMSGEDLVTSGLGVAAHLVKPISRGDLLEALSAVNVTSGTVLIVDDEPDALQLFGRVLASSERGYRVLLARDGQEALGILQDYRADVILLDLVMPNMDGFQFLHARRQDPSLAGVPVILISARDPAGQPIVSSALAITQGGGLSARQVLSCIEFASRALAPGWAAQASVPTPPADLPG